MKRFTETTKWRDPWFSDLNAETKLAWLWLLDNCDHAGVIEISFKHLQFETGYSGTEDELLNALAGKITFVNSKCFVLKFIDFQYQNFETSQSKPIISARNLLTKHGILYPVNLNQVNAKPNYRVSIAYNKPNNRTKEEDGVMDQYKDGVKEGVMVKSKDESEAKRVAEIENKFKELFKN